MNSKKLTIVTCLIVVLLACMTATAFAFLSPFIPDFPGTSIVYNYTDDAACPCTFDDYEWGDNYNPGSPGDISDDTGADSTASGRGRSGRGTGGGSSGEGGSGGDGNTGSDSGGNGGDSSDECNHSNKCPVCGDCTGCGDNPHGCHACCDEDRRCDICIAHKDDNISISVVIDDELLRIGSELSFITSGDPSGFIAQWRVGGRNVPGANGKKYIVRPDDADKTITVVLISPCRNFEAESPPTTYVPFTIKLITDDITLPMEDDYVYFEEKGNYVAYAASKDNGFVDINYVLWGSDFGTDTLDYKGGYILGITTAGSGESRYYANPSDALNGVITIKATFYHIGISLSSDGHVFDDIECAYDAQEQHKVIVSNIGNYQTGQINIYKFSNYPSVFYLSRDKIDNLSVGESTEFYISKQLGNVPSGSEDYQFKAEISIGNVKTVNHIIPVSMYIRHSYGQFEYRGGYHEHNCIGCDAYSHGDCEYGPWSRDVHGLHSCTCKICSGTNSHTGVWSAWSQGTDTHHTRTCSICQLVDNLNHTFGWGVWTQGDSNNHHRAGTCTDCGRAAVSGVTTGSFAAHTWTGFTSLNATHHRRTCTECARPDDQWHTMSLYAPHTIVQPLGMVAQFQQHQNSHYCPGCGVHINTGYLPCYFVNNICAGTAAPYNPNPDTFYYSYFGTMGGYNWWVHDTRAFGATCGQVWNGTSPNPRS